MLRPIDGQLGLFRDTDTGQVVNVQDFKPYETTARFGWLGTRCCTPKLGPLAGHSWILTHWAVVLHPWHTFIDPALTVTVQVNDQELIQDMPLFRVAEPLERAADPELERRIERLEERIRGLDDVDLRNPSGSFGPDRNLYSGKHFNQMHQLSARIVGPADVLTPLLEMTKHCLFRVQGLRRVVAR